MLLFFCSSDVNYLSSITCSSYFFQMDKSDAYKKGKAGKKWDGGGPGGPGSGPYGGGPRGPPRGLDNVRGIDHSESLFSFLDAFYHFPYYLRRSLNLCFNNRFPSCLWFLLWLKGWSYLCFEGVKIVLSIWSQCTWW